MATFILIFGGILGVFFTCLYIYQFIYIFIVFSKKPRDFVAQRQHRYAALISARNEEVVIGKLVESLHEQDYPSDLLDVYVVADNCTDRTADAARAAGAFVIERFNQVEKGKSYALDVLLKDIFSKRGAGYYDGFFVFDADGVLDNRFVAEMNAVFDNGYRVVTSYRNSKNFDSNWISAASGLWFMREGRFLSEARFDMGTSCMISGTGFLIAGDILAAQGGWVHHAMTEDIQFSADCVVNDEPIGFARKAVVYDEQPITFRDSWNQRLRWARGFYQVFGRYWKRFFKGLFRDKHSFACFDMIAFTTPVNLATIVFLIILLIGALVGVCLLPSDPVTARELLQTCALSAIGCFGYLYCVMFLLALITTVTEHEKIHASRGRMISNIFLFPFFILTYFPIAIAALGKVEWRPISHTVVRTAQDVVTTSTVAPTK